MPPRNKTITESRLKVSFIKIPVKGLIFLILLTLFSFHSVFSQTGECGVNDENAAGLIGIQPYPQSSRGNFIPNTTYNIPLHVYIFHDDNGVPPHPLSLENFALGVNFSNEVFPEEFNFYICKVDRINNSTMHFNQEGLTSVSTFYNFIHDDNAVNVYIRKGGFAWGGSFGVVLNAAPGPSTVAHELGHRFALQHTDHRTTCITSNSTTVVALTPQSECISGIACNANFCNCAPLSECTGDRVGDTPVDPGNLCTSFSLSGAPCVINQNGTEYIYTPDYLNIMTNSYQPMERFTDGQKLRMVQDLLSNNAFLTDDDFPECEDYDINTDIEVASRGHLEKITDDALPMPEDDHYWLSDINVRLRKIPGVALSSFSNDNGIYAVRPNNVVSRLPSDIMVTTGQCEPPCPELVNPLEGVNTDDVIAIQKHILSVLQLEKPFKWIAADVNNDGIISTADNVHIRRLILGIDPRFTEVPSWRLLPKYALEDQWDFLDDFFDNPFTAAWDYQGQQRGYLPSGANSSYMDALPLHLLNNDVTKEKTWSFWSVKSGDVNFSHADPDGLGGENTEHKLATAAHTCLQGSERFTVLVKADGIGANNFPLSGYQWGMLFDMDAVEITGVSQGALPYFSLDNFNQTALDNGELRTLWYSLSGNHISIQNGELLFKVHLKAKKQICNIADVVYLEDKLVKNAAFGENAKPVSMDVKLEVVSEERKHRLEAVFPNPGANEVNLSFQLDEAANVNITVSDQYNHQVNHSGYYPAGTHTVTFANTNTLLPGILTYQAMLGQEMNTGIIIKQ